MIPGYGRSSHSSLGVPSMRLHYAFSTFTIFFYSAIRGLVPIFTLLFLPECFCILFEIFLCRAFIVTCIVNILSTIISGDVIKVSSGFLFILFCFNFIIPSFSMMCEHKLVADTLILGFPIRVIIRLVI